jgi:predicted GIY-YIG superfamily endonuclease
MRDLIRHILREERIKWTKEMVQKEADKYNNIHDFRVNSRKAYRFAENKGWLPEITKNLSKDRKRKYNIEDLKKLVNQYEYLSDFLKNHPKEVRVLRYYNLFDEVTQNLKRQGLSKDEVMTIALRYNTKSEFEKNDPKAFHTAKYHGWYPEVTAHMTTLGNLMKRAVYVWEFPDNTAYVGLTFNIDRRKGEHLNELGKTMVSKHIQQTKLIPNFKVVSEGYIGAEKATQLEDCLIEEYRNKGWKILNVRPAGGLGGCKLKYTKQDFIDIIAKYKTLKQFRDENRDIVVALERYGLYDELTSQLERSRKYWTDDEILSLASKYETIQDFRTNEPKAFSTAKNRKLKLNLVSQRVPWTYDRVKTEVEKYKNKNEFQNANPSAYNSANRNGWLDIFYPN